MGKPTDFLTQEQLEELKHNPVMSRLQLTILKQQIKLLHSINLQLKKLRRKRDWRSVVYGRHTEQSKSIAASGPTVPSFVSDLANRSSTAEPSTSGVCVANPMGFGEVLDLSNHGPSLRNSLLSKGWQPVTMEAIRINAEPPLAKRCKPGPKPNANKLAATIKQMNGIRPVTSSPKKSCKGQRPKKRVKFEDEESLLSSSLSSSDLDSDDGPAAQSEQRALRRKQPAALLETDPSDQNSEESGDDEKPSTTNQVYDFVVDKEEGPVKLLTLTPVAYPVDPDDPPCSVCGDADDSEDNVIVLCDGKGCEVAVHQQCYGLDSVPEGSWYCDGCALKLCPTDPNCALCPVTGGALRKVTALGRVKRPAPPKGGKKRWPALMCHAACALWIPEVTFGDPTALKQVELSTLSNARVNLGCGICKQKGGAAMQCNYPHCFRAFHVLCGRAQGQHLTFTERHASPIGFCAVHSAVEYRKVRSKLIAERPVSAADLKEAMQAPQKTVARKVGATEEKLTEYELERERNIHQNKRRLKELMSG